MQDGRLLKTKKIIKDTYLYGCWAKVGLGKSTNVMIYKQMNT